MADDVIRLVPKSEKAAAEEQDSRAANQAEMLKVLEDAEAMIAADSPRAVAVVIVTEEGGVSFVLNCAPGAINHLGLMGALGHVRDQVSVDFDDE